YLHYAVEPLYTFALVNEQGLVEELRAGSRDWRPDRLNVNFSGDGLLVRETRVCGPTDVVASVVEVENPGPEPRRLQLIAWTAQPVTDDTLVNADESRGMIHVRRVVGGLR